ncbi:MAG: glycosyltransferase family 2 protein, partial [Streptosporangiaceae bacterium]
KPPDDRNEDVPPPEVSVIVPVYNGRATLGRCVESVLAQTLGDFELFLVDDGSTDGSAEELDKIDDPRATVLHQANSGGPGSPRNAGLDLATGEFVFFLDADDWLGPEALERMVAAARENGTDVVIGKYVGVGRTVPRRLFRRNVGRTTVLDDVPDLYASLAPLKLFRRSLLGELRFPEGLFSHEDQAFTATAYFQASGVSVLADYDYYFWVEREDGSSVLQQGGARDEDFFPAMSRVMQVVVANTEPGPIRNRMLRRNFRVEIFPRFGAGYVAATDEGRKLTEQYALGLLRDFLIPEITEALSPFARQVAHCLEHGLREELLEIVRFQVSGATPELQVLDGRAHALTPGFGILPQSCYDVTDRLPFRAEVTRLDWAGSRLVIAGTAEVAGAGPRPMTLMVRQRKHPQRVREVPIGEGPGFSVDLDLSAVGGRGALGIGLWDLSVATDLDGMPVEARLHRSVEGPPPIRFAPVRGVGQPLVKVYFTEFWENLSLHLGVQRPVPEVVVDLASVSRGQLRICGRLPAGGPVTVRIVARNRADGQSRAAEARLAGDAFEAEFGLRDWHDGPWRLTYEIIGGDGVAQGRLVPGLCEPGSASLRRLAIPFRTNNGELAVKMRTRPLFRRAARRLGLLR